MGQEETAEQWAKTEDDGRRVERAGSAARRDNECFDFLLTYLDQQSITCLVYSSTTQYVLRLTSG